MMRVTTAILFSVSLFLAGPVMAEPEQYEIDKGHTFVAFEISHIGFAWIPGTFNDVEGSFTYDPDNRADSSAEFTVDVASIDTEHAKRDKHLRGEGFFNVSEYPEATFQSTGYEPTGEDTARMTGDLTIKGITKEVTFEVKELAGRVDPWEDFRRAFSASTTIELSDFEIDQYGLGPASKTAEVRIAVEGIRQ